MMDLLWHSYKTREMCNRLYFNFYLGQEQKALETLENSFNILL